ncbi:MAG: EAL domain-containing protein [Phyllobacteriaceae bacterium]|nr:EAL domain-containing protein [Phyllobacteriaceae bacterium]
MTIAPHDGAAGGRRSVRNDDGTLSAVDGMVLVRSAFQPVFRCQGERIVPVAFEALARPFRGDTPLLPDAYFSQIAPGELRSVEALIRHIHVQNAKFLPEAARRLFLNFHPAAVNAPATFEPALTALGEDLRQSGISPRDLVCEFTEHEETSPDALRHFVYALRARGFLIAVDDFGAAFSDPDRIARLTPDIVKMDGALARRHLDSADGFDELTRIVDTFRRQGIRCVIEGLETMRQVELARRTGAHFLQGFALAPPQAAPGDFTALIAASRSEPDAERIAAWN